MAGLNIVICGAGEVGGHAADVLSTAGHSVTVIDKRAERLRGLTDSLDIRTFEGNAASSAVLIDAGVARADIVISATDVDEVNLVAASVARALGARKTVARLHHRAFFEQQHLDYQEHFGISRLICPEFSTATAIARSLRNPAALATEEFADGEVEMHEFAVDAKAPAIGQPLTEVRFPRRARLVAVSRSGKVFVPDATTVVEKGDRVVLVSNREQFDEARRQFRSERPARKKVVIMGGTPMSVWICRVLRDRTWSIRLFEANRTRAEELATKLDWVTVLNADPTDKAVFAEEQIGMADIFLAMLDDDEDNIVGAVQAKAGGVLECIAVVQRSRYLDLLYHIGVDRSYSPGTVAAKEIIQLLDENPIRHLATLATGIDAYELEVRPDASAAGRPLREIRLAPQWSIGAIRRNGEVWVPGADDAVRSGDSLLLIGYRGDQNLLAEHFLD